MSPFSALAMRAIPADLREKYIEIWQAGQATEGHEPNKRFFSQSQLLSLGLQLRWQADSFRLGRLALRTFAGLLLAVIYAEFGLVRDMLVLLVVWFLIRRSDFRAIHSRRALMVTGVHLCVSTVAFALGLSAFWLRINENLVFAVPLQATEILGNTLVTASFLTALAATILWLVDFVSTTNVLITGKIFSFLVFTFLGIQWLEQSRNTAELINSDDWLSSVLLPVSKIQQVTTNLVLPLLACFMILTSIVEHQKRSTYDKAQQI